MSSFKQIKIIITVFLLLILFACSSRQTPAPIASIYSSQILNQKNKASIHASQYVVQKGETLYSIAWRANTDVKSLAKINKMAKPYQIFPGQKILLVAKRVQANRNNSSRKIFVKNTGKTSKYKHKKALAQNKKLAYGENIGDGKQHLAAHKFSTKVRNWRWPAKGKVIAVFSTAVQGNKGIDIAGHRGDNIVAAAKGKVVYAGDALRGYGKLIIIKHNDDYLSAYAHNDQILVKEQQKVNAGDLIAKMGNTDAQRFMLHFEVRFRGKSINPLKYLPKK